MSEWLDAILGIFGSSTKQSAARKMIGQFDSNANYVKSTKTIFWPSVDLFYADQTPGTLIWAEANIAWAADRWLQARAEWDNLTNHEGTPGQTALGKVGTAEANLRYYHEQWMLIRGA